MPLSTKKKKEKFRETVRRCLTQDQVETNSEGADVATPIKIEKLVKAFKTHRCALDFDKKFITANVIVIE
jgi:hypothetical protein